MDIELHTAIFYQTIKHLIKQQLKQTFDKIIKQQQKNLIELKNLRIRCDPFYAGIKNDNFF